MKQFKKRTLALVLASAVTVVGAFGAENYKNSLMALKFNAGSGGSVRAVLLTKEQYAGSISPMRMNANTYVIVLPDTNSEVPENLDLGKYVDSVDIRTMPYTKSGNGYTKITIRTKDNAPLTASSGIYIAPKTKEPEKIETTAPEDEIPVAEEPAQSVQKEETAEKALKTISPEEERMDREMMARQERERRQQSNTIRSASGVEQTGAVDINKTIQQFKGQSEQGPSKQKVKKAGKKLTMSDINKSEEPSHKQDILYTILGGILVAAISILLMLKARDKMIEVTGERANYDVSDEPKPGSKKKEKPKINTTIKNLDKRYTKPVTMPVHPADKLVPGPESEKPENVQEVENVVDLDELLNEKKSKPKPPLPEVPVNEALEDFLSSFNFETGESEEDSDDSDGNKGINEELYDKYINDKNMEFSKDDVEKIETLMSGEISDEALRKASDFLESSEKNKKPTPIEVLEKLVTTYTVEQNITFTKEDVEALYKLISVEIDKDFVNDLRTNPGRMQEMQDEIARQKSKPHKTSELLTLNVKDMLPDLSEALKKQGGRRIESEVKPQVIYASEGYEVRTLKLSNDALPDLSKEINNEEAYRTRPSDDIMYADTNYEVQTMSIANELPDLEDMLKHPEKYEEPKPEEVKVDEEALLKNITNVTFKPFDDGTREFEVINDIPTVSDMQEEFNQFGEGFEIVNEEEYVPAAEENEQNDFETLYDGKYVDFDSDASSMAEVNKQAEKSDDSKLNISAGEEKLAETGKEESLTQYGADGGEDFKGNENDTLEGAQENDSRSDGESEADKLLNRIKAFEKQRKAKNEARRQANQTVKEIKPENIPEFCILDGERYSIVSASNFTENMGCYLAKNDKGYSIIGFSGDNVFKIKYYEKLDTERIQSRISEKLPDGTSRYIIRLGIHKFILNVKDNNMEFVMDLC